MLFGFTIIIIIFSTGLILAYSSSLEITKTNKEILDHSVVQAESIELSYYFEEQVSIMAKYALNGESTKDEFQEIKEKINQNLNTLLTLIQNDSKAFGIYTNIIEELAFWNTIIENKVFSIPNSQTLGNFLSIAQEILFLETELNTNMLAYLNTGENSYKNRITFFEREIDGKFEALELLKPNIETVNKSIYDNYRKYLDIFTVKYYEWDTEIVAEAILLGDNYSSIVSVGDLQILTDFIHDKGTFIYDTTYYIDVLILNVDKDISTLTIYQREAEDTLNNLQKNIEELKNYSQVGMESQRVMSDSANFIAFSATVLALFIGITISLLIGFIIARGISRPLIKLSKDSKLISQGDLSIVIDVEDDERGDEILELSKSFKTMINFLLPTIGEISRISNDLSYAAEEMASSSEEVNASSEEISSITQQMSKGAQEQTNYIAKSNESTNRLKINFEDKIAEINKTANLIEQISSQVNLLALNASIEAARAGEYGRGFAVVSENIRKLADDSKDSVEIVKNVITVLNDTLSKSIEQIHQSIEIVASVAEETASGAEEASAATEQQVATMEELTASAQNMANMSSSLDMIIRNFKT